MFLRLRFVSSLLCLVSLACFASFSAHAQSIFGTITGTVTDQANAVVPSAAITLTNTTSGDVRRSTSNREGYFSFSSVPAGEYNLLIAVAGFQQYELTSIELLGSSSLNFPVKLEIGTTKTQIEVISQAEQIIPVDSGEKSVVLGEKQLQDFTVVGRNAGEFIKILPGFAMRNNSDGLKSGTDFTGAVIGINGNGDGGSQSPLNGAFVANGAGVNNIDITADGAHVSDPGCNCATPVNPNTDMIQEFKVLTSNYGAENSKGPIVINTIAKAGGKDFHGEGYFYARDYVLNSNTWLNNDVGVARPESKYFFPGFNISGPVLIPHTNFNKKRDKLFFFSGFEAYIQTLDTGLLGATVANAGMQQGNFSPANLALLNGPNGTASGSPASKLNSMYPGGIIPASQINASGLALMKEYPLPNVNPSQAFGDNYAEDAIFQQNSFQWLSRVDYSISDNTKLFVRYNVQWETQQFPVTLWWRNGTSVPYPTPILGKNQSQSVSTSLTHVFNPTMSNEFVFAYTYIDFPNVFQNPAKVSDKAIGNTFTGIYHNGVDQIPSLTSWGGELATLLNPSGFQVGGPSQGLFAKKDLPSLSDSLSKVWGTHTAKFGAYYEFVVNNQPSSNYANGLLAQANWNSATGNPWADLLTGHTTEYEQTNYDRLNNEGYNVIEFFAQDSWKVSRRLTVDYGLRVSHEGAWYDRQNLGFAIFNPAAYSSTAAAGTQPGFQWHANTPGVPLSGFPTRALFYAPRFGLAYDLFGTGKTVLRGGWGQYRYHNGQATQGLQPGQGIQTATICCGPYSFAQLEATNPGTQPFATAGVSGTDSQVPLTTSYSFSVSQRLPFASMLEVSYVGNQSKYQFNTTGVGTNINVVPYGTLFNVGKDPSSVGSGEYAYAPYSLYQAVNIANHNLYSNYNALQVSWVRQKGRYDITLNYTYSKSLGIVGSDQLNLSQDYGAEPYDRRNIFNAAYSIELGNPVQGSNKLIRGVVNGWQLSGITQLQSGVNLSQSSSNGGFNATGNISSSLHVNNAYHSTVSAYSINGTDQVPLQPLVTCNPTANLGPNQYVNGNCFSISTVPGVNGPIVLPEIFGPWFFNSDLSMFKNFQMSESKKLQFRFSAYNFLNHPIWSFTGTGVGSNSTYLDFAPSTSGGLPVNTNAAFGYAPIKLGNRIVQLAVKFYF
jgi:hypothetical protein